MNKRLPIFTFLILLLLFNPFSLAFENKLSILDLDGYQSDQTTYYISDSFAQIKNATGTYTTTYYHDGNTLVAREDDDGATEKPFYYHPDHLGSTDVITDQSGNVVEETTYDPYGQVIDGGQTSDFLYTKKEKDSTGLYYFGARYYDPFFRHFTQPDQNIPDLYNADGKTKTINTRSISKRRGELCINILR